MSLADRADLFRFGVPRGTVISDGRVGVASSSSDAVELEGHGLETGAVLTFRVTDGSTLPAPLDAATTYYAIRVDDARFRVAASAGDATAGTAINLTASGGEFVVMTPIDLEELLEWASDVVSDMVPAHALPLATPVPRQVRSIVARLAGSEAQRMSGVQSVSTAEAVKAAGEQMAIWSKGIPLRNIPSTAQRTNLAISLPLSCPETKEIP